MAPKAEDFREELNKILAEAQKRGAPYVEVSAGELHRRVGDYPGTNHRMPVCCEVMRQIMKKGDEIISEPPKGKGASLTIRYKLPR